MGPRVKIAPQIAAPVARRLRLAATLRSSGMSAVVNDVLDRALPSLDEIRAQLAAQAVGEKGLRCWQSLIAAEASSKRPGRLGLAASLGL